MGSARVSSNLTLVALFFSMISNDVSIASENSKISLKFVSFLQHTWKTSTGWDFEYYTNTQDEMAERLRR